MVLCPLPWSSVWRAGETELRAQLWPQKLVWREGAGTSLLALNEVSPSLFFAPSCSSLRRHGSAFCLEFQLLLDSLQVESWERDWAQVGKVTQLAGGQNSGPIPKPGVQTRLCVLISLEPQRRAAELRLSWWGGSPAGLVLSSPQT